MYFELFTKPPKSPFGISDPMWVIYKQMDQFRRTQGAMLDLLGARPVETPYRVVLRKDGITLRHYGSGDEIGPVVLLIPAPIKRAYIWDIAPSVSVIRRFREGGMRVFLIDWEEVKSDKESAGLAEYANRFILESLDAIASATGKHQAFLAGHSVGGTFASIFASLYPERTQGLILLGCPLNFGNDAGDFAPFFVGPLRVQLSTASWSDVPGAFLSVVSAMASPMTFLWARWKDRLESLIDAQAKETHLRVSRWTLDEMPFPRRLFEEVGELLYRENRFMSGTLQIRGQLAAPERIEAPVLGIIDPRCRVAPPESILPFLDAVRSTEKQVLFYEGDTGVALQHVGMLVGKRAHLHLWPDVLKWIENMPPSNNYQKGEQL